MTDDLMGLQSPGKCNYGATALKRGCQKDPGHVSRGDGIHEPDNEPKRGDTPYACNHHSRASWNRLRWEGEGKRPEQPCWFCNMPTRLAWAVIK